MIRNELKPSQAEHVQYIPSAVLFPVNRAPFYCDEAIGNQSTYIHPYKTCIITSQRGCKEYVETDSDVVVGAHIGSKTEGVCMLLKDHLDYSHALMNVIDDPRGSIWFKPNRIMTVDTPDDILYSGQFVNLYSNPHYIAVDLNTPSDSHPLTGTLNVSEAQAFKIVRRYSNWGAIFSPVEWGAGFSISMPLTTLSLSPDAEPIDPDRVELRMTSTNQPVMDEEFIFTIEPVQLGAGLYVRINSPVVIKHPRSGMYVVSSDQGTFLSNTEATTFHIINIE